MADAGLIGGLIFIAICFAAAFWALKKDRDITVEDRQFSMLNRQGRMAEREQGFRHDMAKSGKLKYDNMFPKDRLERDEPILIRRSK